MLIIQQTSAITGISGIRTVIYSGLIYDTKTGDMKLIYFDKDGSNEKSAGVLWNGENVVMNKVSDYEKNMILHKGYIYYCYETDMQEETTVYRLKIDG